MSASICWQPLDPKTKSIGAWAPSSFMEAMERAGMGLPCELTQNNIPVLNGMAAAFGRDAQAPNPYQQILDALEKHDSIRLWASY